MKTSEKILAKALFLFNEKGPDQVSALQISQELGISYGNLTYHFNKKDDIILTLYQRMQTELNNAISGLVQSLFEETFYLKLINQILEVTWNYRFVYLNLSSLMTQFEEIKNAEKNYAQSREKILSKAQEYLIREGFLQPADQVDYQLTIRTLSLILYSWISDANLFYKGDQTSKLDYYARLFFNVALPSLTEKGMEKYRQLRQSKSSN